MEAVTRETKAATESRSVWAIGDIHGRNDMLTALLAALPRKPQDFTVFLGDYIDRGPDSALVVQRVLAEYDRAPDQTILLWGNHEDLAASYWNLPNPSTFAYDPYDWFRNGGTQAMESFGFQTPDEITNASCPPELARLFGLLRPFWRAPEDLFPDVSHVIWVHAGIIPGKLPEYSTGDTLLWVRDEFLKVRDTSGRLVIHGHTPVRTVHPLPDKIGIDTGAVFGGLLSALQMPERRLFQADAQGRVIDLVLPLV